MIQITDIGPVRQFRLSRTIAGRSLYITSAYYVDGLMIDTGCAHTVHELVAAVSDLNINRIVNTHSHEDHIGANAVLQKSRGAQVLIHPLGVPVLDRPRSLQPLKPYQRLFWGRPSPSRGVALGDRIHTDNHRFRVLHTPGHCPDHVCLYEPDHGWLFSGDTCVGGRDRALRADYNIWQIIASLKKMEALSAELMFTASGRVRENPSALLREKIDYLENLGDGILLFSRQGLSRNQIRAKMFGRESYIYYISLGHFSAKQLVRSFIEDRSDKREV